MPSLLRTKRWVWIVAFAIMAALSAFGYASGRRYLSEAQWVRHTFEVTTLIQGVLSHVTDTETGQRGYLITGDESFLGPYREGLEALPRELEQLQMLTKDNPHQQARLDELVPLVREKCAFVEQAVERRRSGGDYFELVRSGRGKQLMDDVRRLVDGMLQEEQRLLIERSERAAGTKARLVTVLGVGSLVMIALILLSLFTVQRDLAELTELSNELAVTEEKFRKLADQASDLVRLMGPDGVTTYVSPSVRRLLGYSPEELMALSSETFTHPDDRPSVSAQLELLVRGEAREQTVVVRYRQKSGDYRWFEAVYSAIRGAGGAVDQYQIAARDIDDRKRAEQALAEKNEELRALSLRDVLTGLPNRRGFLELSAQQVKTAQRDKRPLAVVFVDLDGLKPINDQLGHEMGDRAIAEAGRVLRDACRGADVVARLGGDEFAVVGLDLCPDNFGGFRTRLDEALEQANAESQRSFRLSFSVGVAFLAGGEREGLEELLKRADAAMYEEKRRRKVARGS